MIGAGTIFLFTPVGYLPETSNNRDRKLRQTLTYGEATVLLSPQKR